MFLVLPIFKTLLTIHLGITKVLNIFGNIRRERYLKSLLSEQRILIQKRELNLSLDGIKINDRSLEIGDRHIRSYYFSGIPQNISRENIYKVLDNKLEYIFTLHISQSNRSEMIKLARQRISVLESINEEREQKGRLRKIEHDKEIEELNSFIEIILEEDERSFLSSMYMSVYSSTRNEVIDSNIFLTSRFKDIDYSLNISTFDQLRSFNSNLPLLNNEAKKTLRVQTQSLNQLLPLVPSNYLEDEGIYLGKNENSSSLVILNFFKARNANINILGTSGSGKSETSKLLIRRLHMLGTKCLILDPEGEYLELTKALGGKVYSFSSKDGINAFGIQDTSILKGFLSFFLSSKSSLSILDKVLNDLKNRGEISIDKIIECIDSRRARDELEILRSGSLKGIFNSEREISFKEDLICFDLSSLKSEETKIPAMYLLLNLIDRSIEVDKNIKKMIFIDEAHKLLRNEVSRSFYINLVKTVRKRSTGVVTITQNPEDFSDADYSKTILTQAESTILLKQSYSSLNHISENRVFPLSEVEEDMLPTLEVGEGFVIYEGKHIQIHFDNNI